MLTLIGCGLLLVAIAAFTIEPEALKAILTAITQISKNASTPAFICLAIILPVFGIPISIFIVLAGIKFGLPGGLAVIAVIMPLHLIVAFQLVKIIRPFISSVLARYHYTIPRVAADQQASFSFLLAALPVAPYVIKIYLPPLAGISFQPYFWINWICQYGLVIPIIILGGAISEMDGRLLGVGIVAMVLGYLVVRRLEKRYGDQVKITRHRPDA